jgi:hypothetical protein
MAEQPAPTDPLTRLVAVAEEQLRWQRAAVLARVRETIEQALGTTQLRRAYEMCDGVYKNNDIAKAVGSSEASVSRWAKRWRDLGVAYEVAGQGGKRNKHLASLDALGLSVEVEDRSGRKE